MEGGAEDSNATIILIIRMWLFPDTSGGTR